MNQQKGFAPIVIIFVVVAMLGAGVGGFVLVSKNKAPSLQLPSLSPQTETTPAPSPSNQTLKTKTPPPPQIAANPKELLGWWEAEEGFPFLKEFTDEYFCNQYSSRSTCVDNFRYRVEGNKIFVELEWLSGHPYATWKMVGDKLELTSADSPSKKLYKKIGPPTSQGKVTNTPIIMTRPGLPAIPKANLKLVKVSRTSVCLKHEGGDSFSVTNLDIRVGNQGWTLSLGIPYPPPLDFIFDPGEAWIFNQQMSEIFQVGDQLRASINSEVISPLKPTGEPDFWTVEKIVNEDNISGGPIILGGLASCP